jgi:hypothetical protein
MGAGLRVGHEIAVPAGTDARSWPAFGGKAVRAVAAALGLAVIGGYVAVALARLTYPFTLEVLESNSLVEVHRILSGHALYAAPSVRYVPDGYPPLYFGVSAVLASVLGQSYLPLRLVSLGSSLACFAILARLVQRETGSASAGIAASGVLAATYFMTHAWFDIARVDSLFLAFSIAGLYVARWASRTSGAVAAGVLLGAAFLTKQTALAEGVAVLAALTAGPRRRLAVPAALAYGTVTGGSTLILGLTSHGWYLYYVFEQMSEHTLSGAAGTQFWTSNVLSTLGLAVCAAVVGVRRVPLVLACGCAALAVAGWTATLQVGGNVNDLLPAYLAVAVLAGLAIGSQPDRAASWPAAVAGGLVIAQLAVLAAGFRPARAIPPDADRATGQRLEAGVRALGGAVAIPGDPGLALMAGLPEMEDQVAAADVLRASDLTAKVIFKDSIARAIAERRFAAIITELNWDLRGFPADLPRYYHRCPQMPLDGTPPAPFPAGTGGWPVSVWLPVGRGSCAVAVRTLDAPVSERSPEAPADQEVPR